MEAKNIREDEIDLRVYWKVLVKYRRLIGYMVGTAFAVSIIVSLLLPNVYSATASMLPPQQDVPVGSALSSQLPSGLIGPLGGFLGVASPADLWVGILRSNTVRDAIINRFDLREIYGEDTLEDTRTDLDDQVSVEKSEEQIISVTVEDKDPVRAAVMANAFVMELDRVNRDVVMTTGKRMRVFVEGRMKEATTALAQAENDVKTFQEKNGAVKLDEQSRAVIEAIGTVKGQLMAKEVELQTLLSYAPSTNPQAQILKSQVNELNGKLQELEQGQKGGGHPVSKSVFIPTTRIPDLMLQYARLLREATVQETLVQLLTQQYEMSRVQEAKDSPTVQSLDKAKVPEKRSKPKRTLIVLLATLTAAFLAAFVAFFLEYLERTQIAGGHDAILYVARGR